jgi:hypothetical protein
LPILLWRALFNLFHLSSYWPYLVPLLLAEVVVMHLLWRLCRRNAVGPWVAATAVAVVGFLGAGGEDLGWAFQIGFVGSVALGLGAVLLVDRSAPTTAHCAIASLLTLASLMCSTVGDAMTVALAIVLFCRQPAKRALAVLALPVMSYAVWWEVVGRLGLMSARDNVQFSTFTNLPSFILTGLSIALGRTFNFPQAGAAVLLALGAWFMWHVKTLLTRRPALVGLSAAAIVFYVIVALGRDMGVDGDLGSTAPRYIYIGIALLMPMIACSLSSARDWARSVARGSVTTVAVVVLLIVTAFGGAGRAESWATARVAMVRGLETNVRATARLLASGAWDATGAVARPIAYSPDLTAQVLYQLGSSGLLGNAAIPPADMSNARALLAVGITPNSLFPGHFYVESSHGVADWAGPPGCMTFGPLSMSAPSEVLLRSRTSYSPSSVRISLPTSSQSGSSTVGALVLPPDAPASWAPVALQVPGSGIAYLDYNYPQAGLFLEWTTGMPLTLCGIAPKEVARQPGRPGPPAVNGLPEIGRRGTVMTVVGRWAVSVRWQLVMVRV